MKVTVLGAALAAVSITTTVYAAPPVPVKAKAQAAVNKGVDYLKSVQEADGFIYTLAGVVSNRSQRLGRVTASGIGECRAA